MAIDVGQVAAQVRSERIAKVSQLPVFRLSGPSTELLPPGSGALIFAAGNSEQFNKLNQALIDNDLATIDAIVNDEKPQNSARTEVPIETAVETFKASKILIDLNFETRQVVLNAFPIEGLDLGRALFAYTGGDFQPSDFRITQYSVSEREELLQALVVVHAPSL